MVRFMALALLSGCSGPEKWFQSKKIPIQGARSPLYGQEHLSEEKTVFSSESIKTTPVRAEQWSQPAWNAAHHMGAFTLDGAIHWPLVCVWKKKVSGRALLPVAPVASTDRIFIADHLGFLSAFDWHGQRLWSVRINQQKNTYGMGGGLATDGLRVYITTPHQWVLALDCATGKVLWSYALKHPARNGPVLCGGNLAILTLANQTVTLDACTGKERWDDQGMREDSLILGGSVPAMTNDKVFVASVSGEILALSLKQGDRLWDRPLATMSSTEGEKNFRHIQAYPVVVGSHVYATSDNGQIACFDAYSGDVLWSKNAGGMQTPIVVGDTLITLTTSGRCVAMDRHTGKEFWHIVLPDHARWFGPVMAGGLVCLLSDYGELRLLDPYRQGACVSTLSLGHGYTIPPIPIRGGLLFLSENGFLSFYKRQQSGVKADQSVVSKNR